MSGQRSETRASERVTPAERVGAEDDGRTANDENSGERIATGREVATSAWNAPTDVRRELPKDPLTPPGVKSRLVLADTVAGLFGVVAAFCIQAWLRPVPSFVVSDHLVLVLASIPGFALGAGFNRLHLARANERQTEELANIVKTVGVGIATLLAISFAVQYGELSRLWVGVLAVTVSTSLIVERRVARSIFVRLREEERLQRRIVVVGTDAHAIGLVHTFSRNKGLGYKVVGFVGDANLGERDGARVLGPVDRLPDILVEHDCVGVVVALTSVPSEKVNLMTRRLCDDGYHVALSSGLLDIDVTRLRPQSIDGRTMFYVEPIVRNGWQAHAKRLLDITLALSISVLTLPIQILAAIAIKATSPGPVLFRQTRVGKEGELFEIVKFRTMSVDAEKRKTELLDRNEADGPMFKMTDDPRITRAGRLLRKFSIDELPQLWCVLAGSMSMVGPRPALPDECDQWDHDVHNRLRVLPGLTGMWQVSGRSDSSFETYKRMDLYYVDNWSLAHDLKICARTIGVVLSGRGAA